MTPLMMPVRCTFLNGDVFTYWMDATKVGKYMEEGRVVEVPSYSESLNEQRDYQEHVNFEHVVRAQALEDLKDDAGENDE